MKMKMKIEQLVRVTDPDLTWIRETLQESGNKIGNVHFRKRSNGDLRKMCYRLHVKNPTVASAPKGTKPLDATEYTVVSKPVTETLQRCKQCHSTFCNVGPFESYEKTTIKAVKVPKAKKVDRKDVDVKNNQLTVFDVNKPVRDNGTIIGRGAWRCVPLENVERIANNGKIYEIAYSK